MKIILYLFLITSSSIVFCQNNPCDDFNKLNTLVRDREISREEARLKINELIPMIKDYFKNNGGVESYKNEWFFPLEGYSSSSIGGVNGNGYKQKGYDYFDGNRHGGHPAHDIFIIDRDQDELDDYSRQPVNTLSVSNGIVVAAESDWDPSSNLRGGKYIYIFDPASDGLFYYAHNREIFVKLGDIVKASDIIASCGRTGLNAYKKRSPTHLHIMYLHIQDGYPKPLDIYEDLLNAKTK